MDHSWNKDDMFMSSHPAFYVAMTVRCLLFSVWAVRGLLCLQLTGNLLGLVPEHPFRPQATETPWLTPVHKRNTSLLVNTLSSKTWEMVDLILTVKVPVITRFLFQLSAGTPPCKHSSHLTSFGLFMCVYRMYATLECVCVCVCVCNYSSRTSQK